MSSVQLLRLPSVQARTGLSRSSIYFHIKTGTFPRPVRISARCVGWIDSEISQWVESRITISRLPQNKCKKGCPDGGLS
ncbi:MAG: AlpA family transcriptional regulator [Acidobacteriaceae bacterium]|nr:AlpA family transcriptional regulator [Acidobacteriaceae bacterium]